MSEILPPIEPLSEPGAPDEATELAALESALSLGEGFSLLFVCCHPAQRRRLKTILRDKLSTRSILDFEFANPVKHLLDELRSQNKISTASAIFVSGLENSVNPEDSPRSIPLIANLNAARNSFPLILKCPLVLWVSQYVLNMIIHGAPDFFSIRSGTYYFTVSPQDSNALVQFLTSGEKWQTDSLPVEEKWARLSEIERLLSDYQALPDPQRDKTAEMNLLTRAGNMFSGLGQPERAIKFHQQALVISQSMKDVNSESVILGNIGDNYDDMGYYKMAVDIYWKSLGISRQMGNKNNEESALCNLGNAYSSIGQYEKSIHFYEQALDIAISIKDKSGEGAIIGNLAMSYNNIGYSQRAIELHEKSLEISRKMGDKSGEGIRLASLGNTYSSIGQIKRAMKLYRQSLLIAKEIGDRRGEAIRLSNIARSNERIGKLQASIGLYKKSLFITREVGDKKSEEIILRSLGKVYIALGEKMMAESDSIYRYLESQNFKSEE